MLRFYRLVRIVVGMILIIGFLEKLKIM